MEKINLSEKFSLFHDLWSPKIAGELNESFIKLAKFKGEFVWHKHENEDELFLVVKGRLRLMLRDDEIEIGPGELVVVPKGVDHLPAAEEETHVVLIEPKATLNTGNIQNDRTATRLERI